MVSKSLKNLESGFETKKTGIFRRDRKPSHKCLCLWKMFYAGMRYNTEHNHCNQRLGKIFAEENFCLTTIKWIRMSLMNMDDSWAIFVHRIKLVTTASVRFVFFPRQ